LGISDATGELLRRARTAAVAVAAVAEDATRRVELAIANASRELARRATLALTATAATDLNDCKNLT
jgi:hypothetical protein